MRKMEGSHEILLGDRFELKVGSRGFFLTAESFLAVPEA